MSSPYIALLRVRRVEEKQAEIAFAEAQRVAADCEAVAAYARRARDAWVDDHLDRVSHDRGAAAAPLAGLAGPTAPDGALLARLEHVERDAERDLEAARRRLGERRAALLDAQRRRQAVENLHRATLDAEARAGARRAQAELDDFAGITKARENPE